MNTSSGQLVNQIFGFNSPHSIAISHLIGGNTLYVGNQNNLTVSVVNLRTSMITNTISGFTSPMKDIAVDENNRLYVVNNGLVSIVNTITDTIIGQTHWI